MYINVCDFSRNRPLQRRKYKETRLCMRKVSLYFRKRRRTLESLRYSELEVESRAIGRQMQNTCFFGIRKPRVI